MIAAGGTGTLPKLVANALARPQGRLLFDACYGSGYFRPLLYTMLLIEAYPLASSDSPVTAANLGLFVSPISFFCMLFRKDRRR